MVGKDSEKTNLEGKSVEVKEQDLHPVPNIRADIDKTLTAEQEAEKRGISVEQWQDVCHMIGNVAEIDRDRFEDAGEDISHGSFEFDGNGNIIVPGDFSLDDSTVTHLPKNLKVKGSFSLTTSVGLIALPEGLEVGTFIELSFCDSLDIEKALPYLFERILAGKIKGAVLASWKTDLIKSLLPDGLHIDEHGANVIYMDDSILSDGYVEYKLGEAEMAGIVDIIQDGYAAFASEETEVAGEMEDSDGEEV